MGNCLQVDSYPIKQSPKTTYFHVLLWFGNLLFFDGLWLDWRWCKVWKMSNYAASVFATEPSTALHYGRPHWNARHSVQLNGVLMGIVNEAFIYSCYGACDKYNFILFDLGHLSVSLCCFPWNRLDGTMCLDRIPCLLLSEVSSLFNIIFYL
jgi:hypothetical protein